jgi:hypothetical protein
MNSQASDTIDPAKADDGILQTNDSPTAASAPANATEGNELPRRTIDSSCAAPGMSGEPAMTTTEKGKGRIRQTVEYTTNHLPNDFLTARGDEIPERYTAEFFKNMDKEDYPKQNFFFTACHEDIGTLKTVQVKGVPTIKCDIIVWPPTVEKANGDTREDPPHAGIFTFWGENAEPMMNTFHAFVGKDY